MKKSRSKPTSPDDNNNNNNLSIGPNIAVSASSPADKPNIEAIIPSTIPEMTVTSNETPATAIIDDLQDNQSFASKQSALKGKNNIISRKRTSSNGSVHSNDSNGSSNNNKNTKKNHRKTRSVQVPNSALNLSRNDSNQSNGSTDSTSNKNKKRNSLSSRRPASTKGNATIVETDKSKPKQKTKPKAKVKNVNTNGRRSSKFGSSIADQKKEFEKMKQDAANGKFPSEPSSDDDDENNNKNSNKNSNKNNNNNKNTKRNNKSTSQSKNNKKDKSDKNNDKSSDANDENKEWHPHSAAYQDRQAKREKEDKKKKAANKKKKDKNKNKNKKNDDSKDNDDENDDDKEKNKKKSKQAKQDAEFRNRISADIIDEKPDVSFKDVQGLANVKLALYETIILPSLMPDIFVGLREPTKGLLLFGPPGNGKTMIAKCVASECDCTFFSISASSITSKWVGDAERIMRTLFNLAREKSPSIIFIDEIDSLLTARGGKNEAESSRRIKTEFLIQFDGVKKQSEQDCKILVIGATNLPWQLDDAVLRRFGKRILVPLPDELTRNGLLRSMMRKQNFKV